MKNELFNYKISSSFSKSWISTLKNVEIQQKRALSHNYGNLYHYGANNPVKFTDPTGAFDVDDENKTITANLSDKQDMYAAEKAFFILQNDGFSCIAKDSETEQSITFNNAKGMYSFLDGTYSQYSKDNKFNFMEFLTDLLGLATSPSSLKETGGKFNFALTTIAVSSDAVKATSGFRNGNVTEGLNSTIDSVIGVIGYGGVEGACLSIGLKYTKRGFLFSTTQLGKAQIELERNVVNNWTKTLFGITVK